MAISFKEKVRGGYSISAGSEDIILDSRLQNSPALEKVVLLVTAIRAGYVKKVTDAKAGGLPVEQLRFKRDVENELKALEAHKEASEVLKAYAAVVKAPRAPKAPKEAKVKVVSKTIAEEIKEADSAVDLSLEDLPVSSIDEI